MSYKQIRIFFVHVAIFIFCGAWNSITWAWPIPDTGQTRCYNNTVEITCPTSSQEFYGQDSNYIINPMSYTKLDAEGNDLPDDAPSWVMVRDNVTGLIWENKQAFDGTSNYANPHDADNTYIWYDSNPETNGGNSGNPGNGIVTFDTEQFINALNAANFGEHNDWRLPSIKELASIVNYSILYPGPTINTAYFPNTATSQSYFYWLSTTSAKDTSYAWNMDFRNGDSIATSEQNLKSGDNYVRAVRGGQSGLLDSLVNNGDGTVTDKETGLMWQQATAPGTYTWQEALAYAENLPLAEYNDWRLPTIEELRSLVDYSRYDPAINTMYFFDTDTSFYWSSTTYVKNTLAAWHIRFYQTSGAAAAKHFYFYVRAVRGGQNWSSDHLLISKPTQGSSWQLGMVMPIAWGTQTISGNVSISISYQGGKTDTFTTIEESISNDGAYDWTVSAPAESVNCVLKIVPLDDPTKYTAQGLFSINFIDVIGLSNDSTPTRSKTWTWDADAPATFRYAIDQNPSWVPEGEFSDVKTASKTDGDGTWYLHVQAKNAYDATSDLVTVSAILDNTPPTATLSGASASRTNQSNISVTVGGEGVTHYQYQIDAGGYGSQTPVATLIQHSSLSLGSHTLDVVGRDSAGNWQTTPTTYTWLIETTPPNVTGLSNDSTPTKSKTWNWDADEAATFRYAIDQNSSWTPIGSYSSVKTASKTSGDGTWYIHVQAKDTAGNEGAVTTVSAVLDNTAPTALLSGNPPAVTNVTSIDITVSGAGVTAYQYSLDGAGYSSEFDVSSHIMISGLGDGGHTLNVKGRDSAGNWQQTPTGMSWTVDTAGPSVTGISDDSTPRQTKSWTWGANETSTFRYVIDQNSSWTPAGTFSSTTTASKNSGDGTWYLHIQAKDTAGNEGNVTTVSAILDNTKPSVTNLSDDSTPTKSKTWNWDADETATFRYAIDQNSSWTPTGTFSDTKTTSKTSGDGTWYIHVQAKDIAGNISDVKTVSAILDNTGPTAIISDAPASVTNITSLNVSISGSDVVAYKYRLDSGSYGSETNQANNIVMTGLGEGGHTLDVLGKDTLGNWQVTPTTATWTVDLTNPDVTGLANDPPPKKAKTWTWDANEPATFRYAIDQNSTWTPTGAFSDNKTASKTSGDGYWYLHVQAKDTAGNESAVATVSCRLDNTPPTVWASPEKTLYNYAESYPALNITLLSDDPLVTIYYTMRADLDPTSPAGQLYTGAFPIAAGGNTTIRFVGFDTAGNQSQIYSRNYTLDWVNPAAPAIMPEKNVTETNPTFSPNPTFIWEPVTDAFSYYFEIANNPDFTQVLETKIVTLTQYTLETPLPADGRWYWRVRSVDEAGNVSGWTTLNFVFIDTTLVYKAIVVAGGGPFEGNLLWPAIKRTANRAYQALVYQGFHPENIYYLSDDNQTQSRDAGATLNNLQYAILTWAQTADDLLIVLIDHGGNGTFRISENELLTAVQLDAWLDTIQTIIPGSVTVVYDACQSGSFIPLLIPPVGKERYIVSSANADKAALFAANGTVSFSWYFWSNFLAGEHFYDGYVNAKNAISLSNQQNPMIDVDGNGIANEKNDTLLAENIRIGKENSGGGSPPSIAGVSPDQVLQPLETQAMIYAQGVMSESNITRVWAVITPPDLSSQSPDDPILDLPTLELLYNPGTGRYEGTYSGFTESGRYSIIIFAENAAGERSLPYENETSVIVLYPNPKGDIDGNGFVDLTDLIIALQVLSGIDTAGLIDPDYAVSGADVNGDGKIGIEEVIYILEKVAGLR